MGFWVGDLLTTLTHDSRLHLIMAPLLISTLYKLLEHTRRFFPACSVFISRFPVTDSNSGDSSASALTPFPAGHRLLMNWALNVGSLITPRHGPTENTALLLLVSCMLQVLSSNGRCSVVCFAAFASKRMLFQSHSLATAVSLAPQFLLWANMPQYILWLRPMSAFSSVFPNLIWSWNHFALEKKCSITHGAEPFLRSHQLYSDSRTSAVYGTRRFITMFTRALHWSLL
jgi:hypothetical protein